MFQRILGSELVASYKTHKVVLNRVIPESFLGISSLGLFYGWGALSDEINRRFEPKHPGAFANQHGTFLGVIILIIFSGLMPLVHFIISRNCATEFQLHMVGIILLPIGLILGGISLHYRILWLLYMGCALFSGLGCLFIFCRIVFNHQLWFNRIGLKNLGSGLFGFFVGIWTVIFFVISVPLQKNLPVATIFYIYALVVAVLAVWPLLTIQEFDISTLSSPPLTSNISSQSPAKAGFRESPSLDLEQSAKIDPTNHSKAIDSSVTISDIDAVGFPLTVSQMLSSIKLWLLVFFSTVMLTPGWGIKLAAFSIMQNLFGVSLNYSSMVASVFVSCYAIGRLCAGGLAQKLGAIRAYDVIMSGTFILLMLLPISLRLLPNSSPSDSGCILFSVMICLVGLFYGGGQALLYSLVFEVFGAVNYKLGFSMSSNGFSAAVVVGGLSSAYSFSGEKTGIQARNLGETWFYVMAACTLVGWVVVHLLTPYDYRLAALKYGLALPDNQTVQILQELGSDKEREEETKPRFAASLSEAKKYISGRYL